MEAGFAFVIGCPRSGTTLLRAMLDSHSQLAVPPEAYFTLAALRRADTWGVGPAFDRAGVVDFVAASPSFPKWGLDPAVVERLRADDSLDDVPAVLRALYDAYARGQGKRRSVDKTPRHSQHVPQLLAAFPDAAFLHLVRDGRNVVPSLQRMPYFPARTDEAAWYWEGRVRTARAARALVPRERFLEVRYEDLVADPAGTLTSVCAFLGVGFEPGMLEYSARAEAVMAGVADDRHHENLRRAPTVTRDWRTEMAPADLALVEALVGPLLVELGYPLSGTPATLRVRARVLAARLRRRVRGLQGRLRPARNVQT